MTFAALPELAGRLHPALVHLPIGFLLLLALAELAGWLRPVLRPPPALRTLLLAASLAAAGAAAASGWLLGRDGGHAADLLERHRWAGVGCLALTAALLVLRHRPRPYAVTFAGCLVTLGAAGHLGGTLTHGEDYLWRGAPAPAAPRPAVTAAADAQVFADLIQPLLQQRCVACHGPAKSNGGLRYDTAETVLRGGKSGPLIPPGRPAESLMLRRLLLPLEAKEHMPPKGKPQPTAPELE
ncbi:MAG: c-type cytochrome domain-containing protein, partial [Verrucomicrobiota bacterium]